VVGVLVSPGELVGVSLGIGVGDGVGFDGCGGGTGTGFSARAVVACPNAHTAHADSRMLVISRIEGSPWLTHHLDQHRACH
jgi:hypothetical protein